MATGDWKWESESVIEPLHKSNWEIDWEGECDSEWQWERERACVRDLKRY